MTDKVMSSSIELWRYPITIFAFFLALVGAKYVLGVNFESVDEISSDGIKFSKNAKSEFASLSAQVNELSRTIDELKKNVNQSSLSAAAMSNIFEASQTVSDQTAEIAAVDLSSSLIAALPRGFIWIGDFDSTNETWTRVMLSNIDSRNSITSGPNSIIRGSVYTVSANLVLRESLPNNDKDYFRARRSLGVLPLGTKVLAQSAPIEIDRGFAVQYWLEVVVQP